MKEIPQFPDLRFSRLGNNRVKIGKRTLFFHFIFLLFPFSVPWYYISEMETL